MITINQTIAQKYATALFNVFDRQFTPQRIEQLQIFQTFLQKNKYFLTCLSIPSRNEQMKTIAVEKITTHFKIPFLTNLTLLLLKHKRISLLPLIIKQSIKIYQGRHDIIMLTIKTSHSLQDVEKQHIINFVQKKFDQQNIFPQFFVSPKLICGLSIKSDNFVWEKSIKKTLRQIQQSLFQRVGL